MNMTRKNISSILKKIFSVSNDYSNVYKQKVIYILGIKVSFKIVNNKSKKETTQKFNKLQQKYKTLEKFLKKKKVINITFMVSLASMFPAKPFLDYLLSKPSRYKVKILIVPDFRFGIENTYKLQNECYNELVQKYGSEIIMKVPVDEKDDNINISEFTDILFCSLPYDVSHKKYNLEELAKRNIILAMVNYCIYLFPEFTKSSFGHERLGYFRYIFYETPNLLKDYKKHSIIKGKNGILSGECKMDNYINKEKNKNEPKTIIIAPHHSVAGGYNDILNLSNFYQYSDFFLELPKMYPDINWIFRPHPALFPLLEKESFWGKKRVEEYQAKLKEYKNVKYSTEGDYFNDFTKSDGMIQDCASFLFEYFYTGKPQCYMLKRNVDNKAKFGKFGFKLLQHCYCAYSKEDILNYINNVVIKGSDEKKEKRLKFTQKNVMLNYPRVSEFIFNYFEKIFQ